MGGYFKHYLARPFPIWLFPVNLFMNVVDEIAKPLTLALRLFGNLLAGGLMLSLLAALVIWKIGAAPPRGIVVVPFTVVWKLFDMAIGAIQAFIFALLTIVYFETAMAPDDERPLTAGRATPATTTDFIDTLTKESSNGSRPDRWQKQYGSQAP